MGVGIGRRKLLAGISTKTPTPVENHLQQPRPLTRQQIADWQPYPPPAAGLAPLAQARRRMAEAGQWQPWQALGRRMSIGCVALEVTQRCNLDCTYCYLSESSEALQDIPLEEVLRRIDMIHAHYGERTDVQVTGGDPTLRKRSELVQIVRAIRARNMQPSLLTNGIKASRDLLEELCAAGLEDVAFHVDLTQQREGLRSEAALNAVREEYIERVRGLPLSVFFNTTVCADNFDEIPALARFFAKHSDVVRLAAFQIGADTGRGTERGAVPGQAALTPAAVQAQIEAGLGTRLEFDAARAGHAQCNRYAFGLVVNGRVYDFLNDRALVHDLLAQTAHLSFDRRDRRRMVRTAAGFLIRHPRRLLRFIAHAGKTAWQARADLFAARGKVGKLSFHIHHFQDAQALDESRCAACSFMVMTPEGPLSMCVHNAKRDDYLLLPTQLTRQQAVLFWHPATGAVQSRKPGKIEVELTRKNARGRAKAALAPASPNQPLPAEAGALVLE